MKNISIHNRYLCTLLLDVDKPFTLSYKYHEKVGKQANPHGFALLVFISVASGPSRMYFQRAVSPDAMKIPCKGC